MATHPRDKIPHICTYHPYRIFGMRNPAFDNWSRMILDFKDPADPKHQHAVKVFTDAVATLLSKLVTTKLELYAAIVPSHEKDKVSAGLLSLVGGLRKRFNIVSSDNVLRRHTTIPKLADGGNREIEVHLNSISLVPHIVPKGATILLLDDVCTSGNSVFACERLLMDAGAGSVIKAVLAHTG